MAKALAHRRRRLRRLVSAFPFLFVRPEIFNQPARQTHIARRAQDRIRSGDRNKMEGAGARDRSRPISPGGKTEMTIAGWYQSLNQRERRLSAIVAAIIFLLLNWYLWGKLLGALNHARADLATRQDTRKVQEVFIRERTLWDKRAQWLKEHQPILKGPGEASTLL